MGPIVFERTIMVKFLTLLFISAQLSIAMGPHYERYEDFCIDHNYKPSVFENRALAWQGLRESEKKQREEFARAQQKRHDDAQLRYRDVISDLQQAITNYDIQQTKKCFATLLAIDQHDEFELWQENRAHMKLYIQNALYLAGKSNQMSAQQIVAQVHAFDQAHQTQ